MANTIAAINGNGQVFAVNAQGVRRPVKAGDELQKGENLVTPAGTTVELMMDDGKLMQVAAGQTVRIDENVASTAATPSAQDSSVTPGTSDTVIQALERGTDLNQTLDATAAGLGGGGGDGGGTSFVTLLRISESVNGNSYNYTFSGLGTSPITEGVGPVVAAAAVTAPVTTTPPTTPTEEPKGVPGVKGEVTEDGDSDNNENTHQFTGGTFPWHWYRTQAMSPAALSALGQMALTDIST